MSCRDVAACGADDLGLEHAAEDALHYALRLWATCRTPMQLGREPLKIDPHAGVGSRRNMKSS